MIKIENLFMDHTQISNKLKWFKCHLHFYNLVYLSQDNIHFLQDDKITIDKLKFL
jgi:hypothetical protein